MALDGDRLGSAIATAIIASRPDADVKMTDGDLETMWKLIGKEIVDEIKNNSVVAPGSFTNSAGPVTGVGGPVT